MNKLIILITPLVLLGQGYNWSQIHDTREYSISGVAPFNNGYIVGDTECLMFIDYKGTKYRLFTSINDNFQGFDGIQVNGDDIYYKELEDLYSPEEIYKYNIKNYKFSRVLRVEDMEGFSLDGDKIIYWTQFQIN